MTPEHRCLLYFVCFSDSYFQKILLFYDNALNFHDLKVNDIFIFLMINGRNIFKAIVFGIINSEKFLAG